MTVQEYEQAKQFTHRQINKLLLRLGERYSWCDLTVIGAAQIIEDAASNKLAEVTLEEQEMKE